MPFRLRLLCLGALLTAVPAHALTVPMTGWAATDSSQTTWADTAGACLLHEETLTQPYPSFQTADEARTFALRVQQTLMGQSEDGQKLTGVVTQPIDRAGTWTVLAVYVYTRSAVQYRATQLFLSVGGRLRLVTGSSANGEASACVGQMHEFLRFLAD
ncbi:hypothetical protein [Deinococcus sp.]|uniref:hypothetical protein n=1 Tax=Deinococcus sp. TaxID=47478 RepID=UPI003C7E91CC